MLKIAGTDSSVGITITDSKEQTTPVDLNMLAVNNPSQLTFIVPAGLADGEYTLTITTQYAGSTLLKTPRTAIATFYVRNPKQEAAPVVKAVEEERLPILRNKMFLAGGETLPRLMQRGCTALRTHHV